MRPGRTSATLLVLAALQAAGSTVESAHYRLEGAAPWRVVKPVQAPGYRLSFTSPDGLAPDVRVEVDSRALRDAPFPVDRRALPPEARAALDAARPPDLVADRLARLLTVTSRGVLDAVKNVVNFTSRKIKYAAPSPDVEETALSCRRLGRGSCVGRSLLAADLLLRAGIPARQVTGVLVARRPEELTPETRALFNESLGGVRHRWIEAYVPGLGWVPSDPGGLANAVTARHVALTAAPEPDFGVRTR